MSKPNILLIMADQLRWDWVGCYGRNNWIKTPNLDKLAEDGSLYTNCYSPNPVCIPARHNLITGLTAKDHGFDDNYFGPNAKSVPSSLPTFAEIVSDAGYNTAAIGKMHFQPERRSTGFDIFLNQDEVIKDIRDDDYAMDLIDKGFGDIGSIHGVRNVLYMQPQESLLPEELHGSAWVADKSIEHIKNQKTRNKPFLLWTGFIHPHPPLDIPFSWAHLYDGKTPECTHSKTPLSQIAIENQGNSFFSDESLTRWRELYASAISLVDYNVGRILKALDEEGLRDNTLVIFVSDHGEMLGDNDTYQKFLAYEPSSHVPLIMRWPEKIKKGTVKDGFVDLNDLYPTMVDVSGGIYNGNKELPGESLFIKNPMKNREWQYIEHQHGSKRWCAIIGQGYKYVHYYGDRDELFDLTSDPNENVNLLFGSPSSSVLSIKEGMKKVLIEYEKKWGLPGCIEGDDFVSFSPYKAEKRREGSIPSIMIRNPDHPKLRSLSSEILDAIKNEKSVKLDSLKAEEVLINKAGFTQEEFRTLLEKAREQGN